MNIDKYLSGSDTKSILAPKLEIETSSLFKQTTASNTYQGLVFDFENQESGFELER